MNISNLTDAGVCSALKFLWQTGAFKAETKDNILLRSLAQFQENKGYLTPKQNNLVRNKLPKFDTLLADWQADSVTESSLFRFTMHNPKNMRVYGPANSPLWNIVKKIDGFVAGDDYSLIPFSKRNCHILLNNGFKMQGRTRDFFNAPKNIQMPDFSALRVELKPYQKYGVAWLLEQKGGAILADEQGLGKTCQAIAWAELSKLPRICIICPASLKGNWRREILLWTGCDKIILLSGKTASPEALAQIVANKWIIINYDILSAWKELLKKSQISAFIFDEAQALKNASGIRSRAATAIAKKKPVLLLSGTPCENRPAEFYPLISLVDPLLFTSKTKFYTRYCDMKFTRFGMDISGASNTQELNKILADTIMLRRKKQDVLNELPDKQRAIIPVSVPRAKLREYFLIENDFKNWLIQNGLLKSGGAGRRQLHAMAMTKIQKLKQEAARVKLPLAVEWVKNYLENEPKLVVFAEHKEIIKSLAGYFDKAVILDGSTPANKRQEICDTFQNDPNIQLFIGNIKAAGTGITLTAAKDTLTIEFAWTSTIHDQCEDRVHRIGQKNAVTAYYILLENTVEEKIVSILEHKRQLIAQIMDGADIIQEDLFDELLKSYIKGDSINGNETDKRSK